MIRLMLRRTLTRQPSLYGKLFICLVCGVMLVSCVLIYGDSVAYGEELRLLERTKGFDVAVSGVTEDHVALFSPREEEYLWDEGTLYLSLPREMQIEVFLNQVRAAADAAAPEGEVTNYYYLRQSGTPETTILIAVVTVVLILFCLLSMTMIYRAFLGARREDVRILYAMGAKTAQIRKLLRTELLILTGASVMVGIPAANLMMYLSVAGYFSVDNVNYARIEYHYSLSSFLITLGTVLLIYGVTSAIGQRRLERLREPVGEAVQLHRINLGEKSLRTFYTLVSLFRNPTHTAVCFALTAPLLVIGIFVSAYLGMYTPEEKAKAVGDLAFYRNQDTEEVTVAEFDAMLQGNERVKAYTYLIYRTDYTVVSEGTTLGLATSAVDRNGAEHTLAEFGVMTEDGFAEACQEAYLDGENVCVVPEGFGLEAGDRLTLLTNGDSVALTVGGTYGFGGKKVGMKFFPLCVPLETYENIIGEPASPYVVTLYLRSPEDATAVVEELALGESYRLRDNLANRQDGRSIFAGISQILAVLAVLICGVEAVLIFTYISMHIEESRDNILTLHRLGCEKKGVVGLYLHQYAVRYLLIVGAAGLVAGPLVAYLSSSLYKPVVWNTATLLPPLVILLLLAGAYWGSVTCSVKGILKLSGNEVAS